MSNNIIQSVENTVSRILPSELHGMESAISKTWSDLSANIWSGHDLLKLPQEGAQPAAQPAGAIFNATEALSVKTGTDTNNTSLPGLELGNFKAEALTVFDHMDTNHQGTVSTAQLAEAIQDDPSIRGNEAAALAALYGLKRHELKGGHPEDINPTEITRGEIQGLPDSLPQQKIILDTLKTVSDPDSLSIFDPNNTGRISEASVAANLGDKVGLEYGQIAQQWASKNLDPSEQSQVSQNGLTTAELNHLVEDEGFRVSEAKLIDFRLQRADSSLANAQNPEAFGNSLNPAESVKPNDVRQGLAGDCYFDSVLSSVAATQPETISNSIKENQNGFYTVTFKGDPQHPITVPAPTDSELALYNGASKDGIWPNIMEKAFADHQILFGHREINNDTPQDAVSGGKAGTAFALLTGEQSNDQFVAPGQAAHLEASPHGGFINSPINQLEIAASQGYDAVVGIGSPATGSGLDANHDYTVVGYQPGTDGGTFELRNPWADQSRVDGDYFTVSASQLASSMEEIAYAPPAPSEEQ